MLPSTGYFKGINCPFYDNGLCERPYCHFRHVKKESQNTSNDGMESGAILQKLVSAAVQKVLQQTETVGSSPTHTTVSDNSIEVNNTVPVPTVSKATYNPTPISELNKINNGEADNNVDSTEQRRRHIPVPYTPRKPASFSVKRPVEDSDMKPFIYNPPPAKYTPGATDAAPIDVYTPKGSIESSKTYLPGSEVELQEYSPNENSEAQPSTKRNYVPSDKNVSKKKILEYKPAKVSSKNEIPSVKYQPTPKSLAPCFSSDEEEPDSKKRKLSSDLNGLDELGAEFDILDQILDEEKSISQVKSKLDDKIDKYKDTKDCKENKNADDNKKEKVSSHKSDDKKLQRNKSDKKEKSEAHDKHRNGSRSSSDKKLSHKSSSRDKNKDEKKDKQSNDRKKHSSSKQHEKSSRHLKSSSSRDSDKSKHSKSRERDKSERHKSHKSSKESKDKRKKDKKTKNDRHSPDMDHNDCVDDSVVDQNEEELYSMSESDEETRALECKRIFEEYVPTEKTKIDNDPVNIVEENLDDEYVPGKKRISRTVDKNIKVIAKTPIKPNFKVHAAQTMADRLAKVKEFHASKNTIEGTSTDISSSKIEVSKNSLGTPPSGHTKIRIAHVPYASTLMNAKKTIKPTNNVPKSEPSTSSTIIQSVKKGTLRVAHMPNEKFIDRPGVLEPLGSKIPANIRSTYLNMMIDECIKIYLTATDAYARAQHEELTTSKKCSAVQIYKNSAVLTVSRLRKELQECKGVKKSGLDCSSLQKIPETISGKTGNAGSWSIQGKSRTDNSKEFSGANFFKNVCKWVLTEEQLQENGFPRPHTSGEKGRAIIYGQNKQKPPIGNIRTCCRCKKDYTVDKKGFPAVKQECIYHPNNKYRVRGEVRYQCCSQDGTSDGCCIAPCHVYEYVNYENLKGYVRTLPPERKSDDYGVYSLDCEMCYTTHGLDLTRVTVINSDCKVVYETLIKPLHPIMDYNTRYSGITEEQMAHVKTTLLEVQAALLSMFNSKTILIGHSLESDFKALKLIHDTVIDTSVLYPHKMGPPYKRALRNLSSEYLKKIIQNSVDGHDSAEDAKACMELIHYKLKEDLKMR